MQDGQALKTLVVSAGKPLELTLQVQGGAVTVAGVGSQARITHANIAACNAMVRAPLACASLAGYLACGKQRLTPFTCNTCRSIHGQCIL